MYSQLLVCKTVLFFSVLTSSDPPAVILYTVGDVIPTPEVNKQKLSRQLAVMDDDEVPQTTTAKTPPTITAMDDNAEEVTSSLNKLSIGVCVCVCMCMCVCGVMIDALICMRLYL